MGSVYIQPGEYPDYGLPAATTAAQVRAASALLDAYLSRPEGLIWAPDWSGMPCYMLASASSFSFTALTDIAPGVNVVVPIGNGVNLSDMIGEAIVLDRANTGTLEACAIVAAAPGTITLATVAKAHAASCTLELGLTIKEERSLPAKRSIVRVAARPVVRLVAGCGRFGYGRRTDQQSNVYGDVNLLAMMQTFGGPPPWVAFDLAHASVSSTTGEIWIPPGLLYGAYFSEARVCYLAGFPAAGLPGIVKSATALAINAAANFPEISGNIKMARAGDTAVERFRDSVLDADMRQHLEPFKALPFA